MTIGDRTVYQSTADGNCIYNAVSIALYGSEDRAMVLKLASIIKMVDDIVPFSKYVRKFFFALLHAFQFIITNIKLFSVIALICS